MAWQGQLLLLIGTIAVAFTMGFLAASLNIYNKLEGRLNIGSETEASDIDQLIQAIASQFNQQLKAQDASKLAFTELTSRLKTLEECLGGVSFYGKINRTGRLEITEVGENIMLFFDIDRAAFLANWRTVLKDIKPLDQIKVKELLTKTDAFPNRESMVFSIQKAAHETDRYIKLTVLRSVTGGSLQLTGVLTDVSELVLAGKQAESDDKAKSEFLATVSHELRTPLNAIIGFARLLKQQVVDNQQMEQDAQTIITSGEALHVILNDILDYSRIEASGLRLQNRAFDLNELLSELYQINRPVAEAKEIELRLINELPPNPVLLGDDLRIRQILQNMLSNAIKFTDIGFVELRATAPTPVNNRMNLSISVRDTGIGISKPELRRLFKPFSQANRETNRKFGGTGLGLAISKGLSEQMGGTINVTSEPGVGSSFSLCLNLAQTELSKTGQKKVLNNTCPLKVLAVDDHPLNLKLIDRFLSKGGHKVVMAESGQEAIDLAQADYFDLILMDIDMPEMDGHEATSQIRQSDGMSSQTFICALSGLADEQSRAQSMAHGMNHHLTKPLSFDELTDLINDISSKKCQSAAKV